MFSTSFQDMPSPETKRLKVVKKYATKFQDNWLRQKEYKEWLIQIDKYTAKCTWCSTTFTVKYDGEKAVKKHCSSKDHNEAKRYRVTNQLITNIFPSTSNLSHDNLRVAAAELAQIYHGLNHHHSYLSTECGILVNNLIFKDSPLCSKIHCGRTKIEKIVQNVLFPKSIQIVLQEMQNLPFSISTDASNKGNKKLFPLVTRYFSKEKGLQHKIIDFYEDPHENSAAITNKIKSCIQTTGLDIKNLVSYGADNRQLTMEKILLCIRI